MTAGLLGICVHQSPRRCISTARRIILLAFLWLALLAPTQVSAQVRVGNITKVLPQCVDVCDAYNVMNTQCNAVGIFDITYIYCECTPNNFRIIEDCFNCQAVNETQVELMQTLLDDIVDTCNEKVTAPDSTVQISPQKILPSPSSNASSDLQAGLALSRLGYTALAVALGVLFGALSCT